MTTPNLFPPKYKGTSADYRAAKVDRNGPLRSEAEQISIPVATAIGTVVGLIPFQSNAKFSYDSSILVDALGAGVTVSLGYVYDDNVTFTNNTAAFLAATTANTANNKLVPNVPAGMLFKAYDSIGTGITSVRARANGWIVAVIGGAATGTLGNITCQVNLMYDQP